MSQHLSINDSESDGVMSASENGSFSFNVPSKPSQAGRTNSIVAFNHDDGSLTIKPRGSLPTSAQLKAVADAHHDQSDSVLSIFRYAYSTFPHPQYTDWFTMAQCPSSWPNHTLNDSISALGKGPNGAAQLLVAIMWSYVLETPQENELFGFWLGLRERATTALFGFRNAPEKYLCWVQNVKRLEKSLLKDINVEQGETFFSVDSKGKLEWLSRKDGITRSGGVIAELPTYTLYII